MKKTDNTGLYRFITGVTLFTCLALTSFVCDKEVSVSPPPPPVETGFMFVRSNPEGATIFLNGRNTGRKTPDSLIYLDYDLYQVTLKKKYFRDTSIYVNVKEGVRIDTSIDYLGNPLMYGKLNITSTPDSAQILLNDSATGYITPTLISHLIPGEYIVRLKKTGFRDGVLDGVEVTSNQTGAVFSELTDTTVWVNYQLSNSSIPTNVLGCITADQQGVKWIGTYEYGVLKFDESDFIEYDMSNSPLPGNQVNCIAVDPVNNIWIGTENGLAVFDRNSWTVYTTSNSGLPNNSIKSIAFEGSNVVWVATSVGLVKYDGTWQVYTYSQDYLSWVNTISIDQAGTKWLGMADTSLGILTYDASGFTNYPVEQYNYPTKNVECSAISPSGLIWFGCNPLNSVSGGLTYFDGNIFTNIILAPFQIINNIFITGSDIKWISAGDGLYKITGTSQIKHFYTLNSPLPSNDIKGSVMDTQGNLWIATGTAGLVKYKGAESNLTP
jgi:streptogramin lyase